MKKIKKDSTTELKAKCEEYLAGWKRAQADYQNLVKETSQQKLDLIKSANESLVFELLPILDNFKAAFTQIPAEDNESSWVVGFSHIKKQLEELLVSHGLEQIKTVGEEFDPGLHEAVEKREEPDKQEDEILEERKTGYTLKGKVIQVAKVVVNKQDEQDK